MHTYMNTQVKFSWSWERRYLAVSVQNIEGCYEELVGVLLLVARQVSGVRPDEVEQLVEDQRSLVTAVELWGRDDLLVCLVTKGSAVNMCIVHHLTNSYFHGFCLLFYSIPLYIVIVCKDSVCILFCIP